MITTAVRNNLNPTTNSSNDGVRSPLVVVRFPLAKIVSAVLTVTLAFQVKKHIGRQNEKQAEIQDRSEQIKSLNSELEKSRVLIGEFEQSAKIDEETRAKLSELNAEIEKILNSAKMQDLNLLNSQVKDLNRDLVIIGENIRNKTGKATVLKSRLKEILEHYNRLFGQFKRELEEELLNPMRESCKESLIILERQKAQLLEELDRLSAQEEELDRHLAALVETRRLDRVNSPTLKFAEDKILESFRMLVTKAQNDIQENIKKCREIAEGYFDRIQQETLAKIQLEQSKLDKIQQNQSELDDEIRLKQPVLDKMDQKKREFDEIKLYFKQMSTVKSTLDVAQKEHSRLTREIQQKQSELTEMQRKEQELSAEIQRKRSELARMQQEIAGKIEQNQRELAEEIRQVRLELDEIQRKRPELTGEQQKQLELDEIWQRKRLGLAKIWQEKWRFAETRLKNPELDDAIQEKQQSELDFEMRRKWDELLDEIQKKKSRLGLEEWEKRSILCTIDKIKEQSEEDKKALDVPGILSMVSKMEEIEAKFRDAAIKLSDLKGPLELGQVESVLPFPLSLVFEKCQQASQIEVGLKMLDLLLRLVVDLDDSYSLLEGEIRNLRKLGDDFKREREQLREKVESEKKRNQEMEEDTARRMKIKEDRIAKRRKASLERLRPQ
jgi:exonuclease SbcC